MQFLLGLVVFLSLVVIKKKLSKSRPDAVKLPPGPWQLPVIGGMHHLLFKLPHHAFYDLAKKYGPLIHLRVGELSIVVASSPEVACEIFKTHDLAFADRPKIDAMQIFSYGGQDLVFSPYGHQWRHLRKTCTIELFSLKRVLSFRHIREEETVRYVRSMCTSAPVPVNLSKMLHDLNNDISARAIIGDHCKDREDIISVIEEAAKAVAGMGIADFFPSCAILRWLNAVTNHHKRCRQTTDQVLNRIINDRKDHTVGKKEQKDEEDLLDVLLRIQGEGDLTTESVKGVILDMMGAGSETASTALEWVMTELMRNPHVMERAQSEIRNTVGSAGSPLTEAHIQEMSYLKLVIKESLRLHPPAPLLVPRECRYSCSVLGYEVPKMSRLLVNVWAIGRDPRYWDKAHDFWPERFLYNDKDFKGNHFEFLPFGAGRRMCPGIAFGIANMEIILAQFLYYFDWKLPAGSRPEDLDMAESFGGTAQRKNNLILCPIPCIACPLY